MSPEQRGLAPCKYCKERHDADVLKCPSTDMMLELAGRRLEGRFRLLERLGSGGMAEVWLAHNESVERKVAIKLLKPEITRDEQVLHRFKLEARASGKIGSPHVCQIIDLGHSSIGPYMVMEWLRGHDLAEWVEAEQRLPVPDAIWVVRGALRALADAHAAGVLHRDLKPGNIFIHHLASGQETVKLMDFGVSKFADTRLDGHTRTGMMLGTPEYMAPEQLFAASEIDASADIWSVGAILYRLLSGKQVYSGDNLAAVCHAVANESPTPIDELVSGLPPGLVEVIHQCLQRDPEKRPENADALAEALAPFEGPRQSNFHRPDRVPRKKGPSDSLADRLRERGIWSMATLPFSGAGRKVTRMVRRPRSWFVLGALAVIGSGALAAIQNQMPFDGDAEPNSVPERQSAIERPPSADSTLAVHRRVDRGQRAKPLTAAELGLSREQHAELLALDRGGRKPERKPPLERADDASDVPPEEPPSDALVRAVQPEEPDDTLVLDDEITDDESVTEDAEKDSATPVIMPPPFVPPADGKKTTTKSDAETSSTTKPNVTPPKHRPSWHGLIQAGKLVTNQKGRGKPPKLPFLEQYPAKQYCLNLGKERVYGLRSWRLATPGEIKGFIKKGGLVRGRYWTTARWKNRARAIAIPSGRSSSEHVGRKKLRPFCVARVK